jgi:hypothetical protein
MSVTDTKSKSVAYVLRFDADLYKVSIRRVGLLNYREDPREADLNSYMARMKQLSRQKAAAAEAGDDE